MVNEDAREVVADLNQALAEQPASTAAHFFLMYANTYSLLATSVTHVVGAASLPSLSSGSSTSALGPMTDQAEQ